MKKDQKKQNQKKQIIPAAIISLTLLPLSGLASQTSQAVETSWQNCSQITEEKTRLACYDAWALSNKNTNINESKNQTQIQKSEQISTQQIENKEEITENKDPVGIVQVGLSQGCVDRQYSELSRFWELQDGSSCPTFTLRGYKPNLFAASFANNINKKPSSPNPDNTAPNSVDYQKKSMRIQLSLRTKLASGILTSIFEKQDSDKKDSIWALYTQQSDWQIFNSGLSRPFRATDHKPEILYIYPTTAKIFDNFYWRYTGAGLVHYSNGQSDPLSRSLNRAYIMTGFEYSDKLTLQFKYWQRFKEKENDDNNADIMKYIGRAELLANWNINDKNNLHFTYKGFAKTKGSFKVEWFHSVGSKIGRSNLKLYTSIFHGYGDTLIDYNFKKTTFNIGFGIAEF